MNAVDSEVILTTKWHVTLTIFTILSFFFVGKMCNINIDECAINPCHNGGTCIDGVNGFKCLCREGYHDTTCQSQLNECLSNPCIHGHCEDKVNGFVLFTYCTIQTFCVSNIFRKKCLLLFRKDAFNWSKVIVDI